MRVSHNTPLASALEWFTPASDWGWPLRPPPEIARVFAPPASPWLSGHRGVDLTATLDQPVLAAGPGTVWFAGEVAGTGVISVEHASGLRTTYQPVKALVSEGTVVTTGQVIGQVINGHTGCPTSVCLHWGLRFGAEYLNPLVLTRPIRVRLYPVL